MKSVSVKMTIALVLGALFNIREVMGAAAQGVNLGGWFVLEPWITPSLFYPFLDQKEGNVAFDAYTFCEVLHRRGKENNDTDYANRWIRAHIDTWYTEAHFADMRDKEIRRVRVPIGDWTMNPYGPYIGCMDGHKEKIQWMLDMALKYNIHVLIDVHTAKDGQNGFDNGGIRQRTTWLNDTHFQYVRQPLWSSQYDPETGKNGLFNYANIQWSISQAEAFLKEFGAHPAMFGYEPVNEPLQTNDINLLMDFYRETRKLTHRYCPACYFVFHDSFRPTDENWLNLFPPGDWDMVAMDHHGYMAFWEYEYPTVLDADYYCTKYEAENNFTTALMNLGAEVWMGEWAFAVDNCAHWLLGFNDQTMMRQAKCVAVDCPAPYYKCPQGASASDCTFNPQVAQQGPFGVNQWNNNYTLIENGKCWIDGNETLNNDTFMQVANCTVQTIDNWYNASFMWTFHNQLETRWSYSKAFDEGYFAAKIWPETPWGPTPFSAIKNQKEEDHYLF